MWVGAAQHIGSAATPWNKKCRSPGARYGLTGDARNIGPAATPWNRKCSFRVAPGMCKPRQDWAAARRTLGGLLGSPR